MIITKKQFDKNQDFAGKWPFSAEAVAVLMMSKNPVTFAIVHDFQVFALSGILETQDFPPMEESGIWEWEDGHYGIMKKSLTPVFDYIDFILNSKDGK